MLAKSSPTIPEGEGWRYEPKWDGFRSIIFRHGDDVELGSRNSKPLTRYFPEVVDNVKAAFPDDAVVDGELVIVGERRPRRLRSAEPAGASGGVAGRRSCARRSPRCSWRSTCLAVDGEDLTDGPSTSAGQRLEAALGGAGRASTSRR